MYLATDLGKKSRKEIGPRRTENQIHVFGKRSWKEILERNLGKKSRKEIGPRRRNQDGIKI